MRLGWTSHHHWNLFVLIFWTNKYRWYTSCFEIMYRWCVSYRLLVTIHIPNSYPRASGYTGVKTCYCCYPLLSHHPGTKIHYFPQPLHRLADKQVGKYPQSSFFALWGITMATQQQVFVKGDVINPPSPTLHLCGDHICNNWKICNNTNYDLMMLCVVQSEVVSLWGLMIQNRQESEKERVQ